MRPPTLPLLPRLVGTLLCGFLLLAPAHAATPQEEAFLKVWQAHTRAPQNHDAIIAACQRVMDKTATLGDLLPVVKTLAAWHLLASGRQSDAVRVFESALTTDKATRPLTRYADAMARRWLTRIEMRGLERALADYYRDNVEFPENLTPIYAMPTGKTLARQDRFGDAWVYAIKPFGKLSGAKRQRYTIHSKNLGARGSPLSALPFTTYGPDKSAVIIARKSANPVTVEFETTTAAGTQRGVASESGVISGGLRFLRVDADLHFAILIDTDADFWYVATAAAARSR